MSVLTETGIESVLPATTNSEGTVACDTDASV